jgi:hypothetical protein
MKGACSSCGMSGRGRTRWGTQERSECVEPRGRREQLKRQSSSSAPTPWPQLKPTSSSTHLAVADDAAGGLTADVGDLEGDGLAVARADELAVGHGGLLRVSEGVEGRRSSVC